MKVTSICIGFRCNFMVSKYFLEGIYDFLWVSRCYWLMLRGTIPAWQGKTCFRNTTLFYEVTQLTPRWPNCSIQAELTIRGDWIDRFGDWIDHINIYIYIREYLLRQLFAYEIFNKTTDVCDGIFQIKRYSILYKSTLIMFHSRINFN
jgi:hypothetical protein